MPIEPTPQPTGPTPPPVVPTLPDIVDLSSLVEDIHKLNAELELNAVSADNALQRQAGFIDINQALSSTYVKSSARAKELAATMAVLEKRIIEATQANKPDDVAGYQKDLASVRDEMEIQSIAAKSLVVDYKRLNSALGELNDKIRERTRSTSESSSLLLSRPRAVVRGMSDYAPAASDIVKMGVSGLPALVKSLEGIGKFAGGFMTALQLVTDAFHSLTRESTAFADVYSARMGMAIDAQMSFINSIPFLTKAQFDTAEIQRLGSAAMRAGAFDAYTAQVTMANSTGDAADNAYNLAADLGEMSAHMMMYGRALGLSADAAGNLLASMATTMGAFGGGAKPTNESLRKVMDTFGRLTAASNMSMSAMTGMITRMSETTMPAGIAFGTLTSQVVLSSSVLTKYAGVLKNTDNAVLASSAGLQKMFEGLFSYGAGISPAETFGYQLAAGIGEGKDAATGIMDAIKMTPFQRLAAQVSGLEKAGLHGDYLGLGMMTAGLPAALAGQLNEMNKSTPKLFEELMRAFSTRDQAEAERRIRDLKLGAAPNQQQAIDNIAKALQLSATPQEQMVTLLKGMLQEVTSIRKLINSPSRMFGFGTAAAPLPARVASAAGSNLTFAPRGQ